MKTLTSESRRIVENNVKLASAAARREYRRRQANGIPANIQELRSDAQLVLCKCAIYHDPTRGVAFSTYFWRAARSYWIQAYRRAKRAAEALADPGDVVDKHAKPVSYEAEQADDLMKLQMILAPEKWNALWRVVGQEEPQQVLAEEAGVRRQSVSLWIQKAIATAREQLA